MVDSKQQWKAWLYLSPAIVLLLVFTVWPIINTIIMAFTEGYTALGSIGEQTFQFGIGNFTKVIFKFPDFKECLINTMILCFATVPISTFLALLIAVCLNSIKPLQRLLQTIFFLPYVTNSIAVGMVFAAMFNIVGTFLGSDAQLVTSPGIVNYFIDFTLLGEVFKFLLEKAPEQMESLMTSVPAFGNIVNFFLEGSILEHLIEWLLVDHQETVSLWASENPGIFMEDLSGMLKVFFSNEAQFVEWTAKISSSMPEKLNWMVLPEGMNLATLLIHIIPKTISWLTTTYPISWINDGSTYMANMLVIIVYIVWNALPFKILILLGGLQSVNKQYYEAAKVDGTSRTRVFTNITIPLLSPMLAYVIITGFIGGFKEYSSIVGIFGETMGPPHDPYRLNTMVGLIYKELPFNQYGRVAAAALILFAIIFVITMINLWVSKKKVHY